MNSNRTMAQSLIRILLVTGLILAVPLVANQFVEGEGWSLFDFALAGGLIVGVGLFYELAVRMPGRRVSAVVIPVIAAVGGAAVVVGEVDDAPGLILIGFVLVITGVVIGFKTAPSA